MCGEAENLRGVERSGEFAGGEDGIVQGFRGFVVGDDDERRGLQGADEVGEIEGSRGGR